MQSFRLSFLSLLFLCTITFIACDKDEDNPILLGTNVTVRNTLQVAADPSVGGTGGAEVPIEAILGIAEGALEITTTVGSGVEYQDYLDGLYDINVSETSVTFTLVAPANHPFYGAFFRTIEPNTFDRYYFSLADNHNINSSSSSDASAALTVLSDNEFVVTIGEGFSFNPGSTFTISLD
ncbi:MAG: hypothetical protein AB8G22_28915 [Saprospiraceae bacterium]